MSHASGSITLYHTLPTYVEARSLQLGIKRHVYFTLLLSNYFNRKTDTAIFHVLLDDRLSKVKRLRVQVTLPPKLRRLGQREALRRRISFSRFMECLVFADAVDYSEGFSVYAVDGRPKPPFDIPLINKVLGESEAPRPVRSRKTSKLTLKELIVVLKQMGRFLFETTDLYNVTDVRVDNEVLRMEQDSRKLTDTVVRELSALEGALGTLKKNISGRKLAPCPTPATTISSKDSKSDAA